MSTTFGKDGTSPYRYGTYMAIVKSNKDPQNMGRCSVWIPEFGGDPDSEKNWYIVSYAAPFAGSTPVVKNRVDGGSQDDSQMSYGMWMQSPDIDNYVLVTFANGDTSRGFWFACVYQQNMNHSVPNLASNTPTDTSLADQGIYPPVIEYNKKSKQNPDSPQRPAFAPLHDGLSSQGLYTDAERGPSSSSARRESPSKTFGVSTPRGSGLVIDDNEENEHVRIRTRGGTQILIHETTGYVYINSKKGNSWISVSDEGIDVYTKKSLSFRAEEDINFLADRDVMIEGARGVFVRAGKTVTVESGENTHVKAGTDFKIGAGQTVQAKAGSTLNLDAGGNLTLKAGGQMLRTASQLHDNGPGATSVSAPTVKAQADRMNVQHDMSAGEASLGIKQVGDAAKVTQAATSKVQTAAAQATKSIQQAATAATGSVATTAAAVADRSSKLVERAQQAMQTVQKAQKEVESAGAKLNSAIAAASSTVTQQVGNLTKQITSVQGEVQKVIDSKSGEVLRTINKSASEITTKIPGIAGQIGGNLGQQISSTLDTTINGAASKATGKIGNLVGQATRLSSTVSQTAMAATGQISGVTAQALGKLNEARALVGTTMSGVQKAATQVKALSATAKSVSDEVSQLATQNLPAETKQQLASAASALKEHATAAEKAGGNLDAAAKSMQMKASQKAPKKTIVERMPTHEPFPSHVKEGMSSDTAKKTPEQQKQEDIASAAARPGQSVANGTPPTPAKDAVKVIQTGTGKITKELKDKIGPLVQIGSHAIKGDIVSAVKEAASVSGVKAGYLMAKASEMGFGALNTMANAKGLMQMTQSTFEQLASKAGAQFGVGVTDIYDARANLLMGAIMTKENSTYLLDKGLKAGAGELKIAHLMGAPIATQFLTALSRDGSKVAAHQVEEEFVRAHQSIFYEANGQARTLQEVFATFEGKIAGKAKMFDQELAKIDYQQYIPPFAPGTFI